MADAPSTSPVNNCSTCSYFRYRDNDPKTYPTNGYCYRYPPTGQAEVFPPVRTTDWCGEFKNASGNIVQRPKPPEPEVPDPPVISLLDPNSCIIGSSDFTLYVHGSGFTSQSVIFFAGYDEPTTLNADGTVSTGVKPSLWLGPDVVQCQIKNGEDISNAMDFTFAAPPPPPEPEPIPQAKKTAPPAPALAPTKRRIVKPPPKKPPARGRR